MSASQQQSSEKPAQDATQEPVEQPVSGSANPDHQGGKVESTPEPAADGAVAATEEEKGGSSD